jgi:hypothetical protein
MISLNEDIFHFEIGVDSLEDVARVYRGQGIIGFVYSRFD